MEVDPELTNLSDNVSWTRRSQKGDLILELKKSKNVTADKVLSQIGESLGQEADIRASRPEITIVYKDIDEKVREDLGKQGSAVKSVRKACGGI